MPCPIAKANAGIAQIRIYAFFKSRPQAVPMPHRYAGIKLLPFCYSPKVHRIASSVLQQISKKPRISGLFWWWSSPIKIRTQRRLDLFKRDRLRPMLIVVGQDQFIIEHIHGVYKCINQAFLKITVYWIAMTELLKPCRHLFAGQLWLLQFSSLDIHKDFFFSCFQLIKPLFGGRRENALLDCFQNVSNGGLGFRKL